MAEKMNACKIIYTLLLIGILTLSHVLSGNCIPRKIKTKYGQTLIIQQYSSNNNDTFRKFYIRIYSHFQHDTMEIADFKGFSYKNSFLNQTKPPPEVISYRHFVRCRKSFQDKVEIKVITVTVKANEKQCSCDNGKKIIRQKNYYYISGGKMIPKEG